MMTLPIKCPTCQKQNVETFPEIDVLNAVGKTDKLWLHSTCHPANWRANTLELQEIREFLGLGPVVDPIKPPRWVKDDRSNEAMTAMVSRR